MSTTKDRSRLCAFTLPTAANVALRAAPATRISVTSTPKKKCNPEPPGKPARLLPLSFSGTSSRHAISAPLLAAFSPLLRRVTSSPKPPPPLPISARP
jgi:hypothetical protein